MLCGVQTDEIELVWDQVTPYLLSALNYADGKYTLESIKALIAKCDAQLWVEASKDGIKGACVTQIAVYPTRSVCLLMLAGGVSLETYQRYLPLVELWAMERGCESIEIVGRRGWVKVLPGFEVIHTVMSKRL